jgi:hypothetical protein
VARSRNVGMWSAAGRDNLFRNCEYARYLLIVYTFPDISPPRRDATRRRGRSDSAKCIHARLSLLLEVGHNCHKYDSLGEANMTDRRHCKCCPRNNLRLAQVANPSVFKKSENMPRVIKIELCSRGSPLLSIPLPQGWRGGHPRAADPFSPVGAGALNPINHARFDVGSVRKR